MSLRKYDPNLLDDITCVAEHLTGEVAFLREVLGMVKASARKGRTTAIVVNKHFALKDIEAICADALLRTDRHEGAKR